MASDKDGAVREIPRPLSHSDSANLWEPLLSTEDQERQQQQDRKDVVFPKWATFWRNRDLPPARLNHNVFLTLVLDVVYGISDSLWAGTVFAAYLKRLGHNRNGPVGNVEAVNGLAVLVSAIPVGYLADKLGRSKVIAAGGVLFILTAAFHAWVLWWIGDDVEGIVGQKEDVAFVLLAVVMALWGIGGGVVSGPAQALYADSTPAGERSKYYMYLFAAYVLSTCMGPLLSIVLFQTIGDDWDIYDLRVIIFVGLGLEMANATIMLFFDDSKALDEGQQEGNNSNGGNEPDEQPASFVGDEAAAVENESATKKDEETAQNGGTDTDITQTNTEDIDEQDDDDEDADRNLQERRKWIPYILFFSSLTVSLGSGMTVKFFPLFFKDDVGLSPTQVQIIYFIVPIVMVIVSSIVTKVAAVIGRVQATILSLVVGLSCLYSMVFFKSYLNSHPFVLVPVYIFRTAFMNSSYPLQESILMDFVPKDQRARWKSLESISQFGWCGSAALGGFLSDKWDYTSTFFLTAVIQSISVVLFAFLLPLVPRKESDAPGARGD